MMKVGEIARREFVKVRQSDHMIPLLDSIQKQGYGKAFVYDRNIFTGIVSKESFIDRLEVTHFERLSDLKVNDFYVQDLMFLKDDDDVYDGAIKLNETTCIVDAVPVFSGEEACGYVTSKEYLKLFLKQGEPGFKVKDLMQYSPVTVFDYTTFDKLLTAINDSTFKHAMVLKGKEIVGIVAVKDLMLTVLKYLKNPEKYQDLTAEELMSKPVATVEGAADVLDAAKIMNDKNYGGLPVVDGGELKGLFRRRDVLKTFEIKQQ